MRGEGRRMRGRGAATVILLVIAVATVPHYAAQTLLADHAPAAQPTPQPGPPGGAPPTNPPPTNPPPPADTPTPPPPTPTPEPSPTATSTPVPPDDEPPGTPSPTPTTTPDQGGPVPTPTDTSGGGGGGGGGTPPPEPTPEATPAPETPTPTPTPTPTAKPEVFYDSGISIFFRNRTDLFGGRISAAPEDDGSNPFSFGTIPFASDDQQGDAKCERNREVFLMKVRQDEDKVVGRDRSDAEGRWRIDKDDPNGTFYAYVVERTFVDGNGTIVNCDAGRSPRKKPPQH